MPFQQNFRQSVAEEEGVATLGYPSGASAFSRSWPDAVAFREAIQQPQVSFTDTLLRQANVSLDRRGLPVAYSGRFAIVFRLNMPDGDKWAVRCFTSGTDADERRARYYLIASHFDELGDVVVPFRYVDRGISVGGEWFPILAMPWVASEPLGRFVEKRLREPEALRRLAGVLTALLEKLESSGISHGDWQHDNLLVSEGGKHVTLVDYDGMYVPEFAGRWCSEAGHPNYQHPARTAEHFGPEQDRFSCLVIQTALLGLANDPGLWQRFSDGESLLFKKSDFLNPAASSLFQALRELAEQTRDQTLADSIACLEDACLAPVGKTLKPVVPAIQGTLPTVEKKPVVNSVHGTAAPVKQEPWYATGATGKRWWQEEKITLSSGVNTAARSSSAQAREVFAFLERLTTPETQAEERKNLWHARIVVPLALSLIALSLVWIATRAHFFPFYVFFWMFNLGNIGYARWPRRKIYDELNVEIQKMEKLVEERRDRLARRRASLGMTGNLNDFVNDRLRKRSIDSLNAHPYNLPQGTVRALRAAGIDNALQLQTRTVVAGVPPHEMVMLQRWVQDIEQAAQNEYRQQGGSQANVTNEMKRLQDEIGEFERAVEKLRREKNLFPDCSFKAYLKRLTGVDRSGTTAASTVGP